MKNIAYDFIEPSTFEVVHLRNTYSNGNNLISLDDNEKDLFFYIINGRTRNMWDIFDIAARMRGMGLVRV